LPPMLSKLIAIKHTGLPRDLRSLVQNSAVTTCSKYSMNYKADRENAGLWYA